MRWPLRYQILFPFAGVMLAVVVGVSILDAVLSARRTQLRIEHQLSEVARTLQEAHFPLTDSVLRQTRGLSGAEFLLLDERGRVRAASLQGVDPAALPSVEDRSPPGENAEESFRLGGTVRLADMQYAHAAVPIAPRGTSRRTMRLHILYPQSHLRTARWEAAYPPLVVGGLLLVVVAALAIAIARRMTRPILELRRQLGRLVQGDFIPLEVPARNDELGDLVRSVNSLGGQLDELRRVIKRSERLSLLGQLSGGLAHELRNAVTGARIAVQLHRRHCREVDQDSLDVALRQLAMTETHLQRFLTAGQPSEPHRETCRLDDALEDIAALVGPPCAHRNVTLRLPKAEENSAALLADAEQLRQLLMNLVLNAVEAAGGGGWVRVEAHHAGDELVLRVLDSGPGPDEQLAARLFEPFATSKPEGIGLGLTVARQIAEAHGGTLRYVPGEATCFEARLPIVTAAIRESAADAHLPDARAEQLRT
ncbi:MAG: sensor histidine kinase [Planctomycetota bacterium]|nr:MAG: sensor histidine kinase [Planctomycetota bacterium]